MHMTGGTLAEALPLLNAHHYLGTKTADPMHVFLWRKDGGLFGDYGTPLAAILYASPINRYFGARAVELTRLVRSPDLTEPLSKFVAWSLRWLRLNTEAAYCLSYADQSAGHHGGIYQALSFDYVAISKGSAVMVSPIGERASMRSFDQRRPEFRSGWTRERSAGKHLYVKALNEPRRSLLRRFNWLPLPYPKPSAARPLDERFPKRASDAQPVGAAPNA